MKGNLTTQERIIKLFENPKHLKKLFKKFGLAHRQRRIVSTCDKPPFEPGCGISKNMLLPCNQSGVYFGMVDAKRSGRYVGKSSHAEGNVAVVSNSGGGKTHDIAKQCMESYKEPIVCLDIKGELSEAYSTLYCKGKVTRRYIVFNPRKRDIKYNPYYGLNKHSPNLVQRVQNITNAIIPKPIDTRDGYWIDMARNVLTAAIIYCLYIDLDFTETMIYINTTSISELCAKIQKSGIEQAKGFISDIIEIKKEQIASIGTELKRHIVVFATDPDIMETFSQSGDAPCFSWEDLDDENAPNIFLVIEQDKLEQWDAVMRLMITQLIEHLMRRPDIGINRENRIEPTLLLLDEFPLLGRMECIKNAITTLRSKKVTICLMLQSLAQLDEIYGSNVRKIIIDNCQYKVLLRIDEYESQKYFSDLIGPSLYAQMSITQNTDKYMEACSYSRNIQLVYSPKILPHQFSYNQDIWLHTPYGFFCTMKLPLEVAKTDYATYWSEVFNYKSERNIY